MASGDSQVDWSDFFKRIYGGEKVRHRDVEPASQCDEILVTKKTETGGIETLGIWCRVHGFIKTGFVGP
jgi:hypothetical protein